MDLEFAFNSRQLNPLVDRSIDRAIARAVSKAGGGAIRGLKISTNRLVRQKRRMKVAAVNNALPIAWPSDKTDLNGLVWTMRVSGRANPVPSFPYRQTKKGVTFGLKGQGPRLLLRSAFVARMRSGHVGVFRRRGFGGGFSQVGRLPIDQLFGPRVSDVVQDRGFVPEVMSVATRVFGREFERLWPLELAKAMAR